MVIKIIRSPMRYPGGKSKAISKIVNLLPEKISEYREPFVGGGSLFIYIKQNYPKVRIRINDKNKNVYAFWKIARDKNDELVESIQNIKNKFKNGKKLFNNLKSQLNYNKLTDFERAVYFFILNRISFSGLTTSGGYSKEAFKKRFTMSSIKRVSLLKEIMQDVVITCGDYSDLLNGSKKNVLIYLDPPYFSSQKSKLYGQNGDLHYNFDHQTFKKRVLECKHNILITYDNSQIIKNMYNQIEEFSLIPLNFQYGMNNIYKGRIPKSKELIITNYKPSINSNGYIKETIKNKNNSLASCICSYIEKNINIWKSEKVFLKDIEKIFHDQKIQMNFNLKISTTKILEYLVNLKYLEVVRRKKVGNIFKKTNYWDFKEVMNNVNNMIEY